MGDIMGVRKGASKPQVFSLNEHGFTWIRHGEAGRLDNHRWFQHEGLGAALSGTVCDWRMQLWEAGLKDLLTQKISEELGAPVIELLPLVDDLARNRDRYDEAYRRFLLSPAAAAHGL